VRNIRHYALLCKLWCSMATCWCVEYRKDACRPCISVMLWVFRPVRRIPFFQRNLLICNNSLTWELMI